MAETKAGAKPGSTKKASTKIFSDEELAAMKESIRERKKSSKLSPEQQRAEGEADVQAKIAEMPADDQAIATRLHKLVLETAPNLTPKTYYGMPAWALDGKVIAFFQSKSKFKVRYSTFGFQPDATLDDEEMWPVAFAVTSLTPVGEKRIAALVKKAAGRG